MSTSLLINGLFALGLGYAVTQIAVYATTIYLHRTLAHKAFVMQGPLKMVFRAVIWLSTGLRPRQWVAVHRKHHKFPDIKGDPYSIVVDSFWMVMLGTPILYRRAIRENPEELVTRYANDLPPDRWDRLLFDHAFLGLGIGIAAMMLLTLQMGFDLWVGLLAVVSHTVGYLLVGGGINALAHRFGRHPYKNFVGRNLQWLALLIGGEGLHNNHHAKPTWGNFAHRRREFDPGWWLARGLMFIRQLKLPEKKSHLSLVA